MNKIKVAVLEDSKLFLKELVDNLRRTGLVDVVGYESNSEAFVETVLNKSPDALLLDIHLAGENINGIHIAEKLKLPVLFLSAERKNYVDKIDILKYDGNFPVEEVGKTPDEKKLKVILADFIPRVIEFHKKHKILIKPKGEEETVINPADVSYIESIKGTGNHILYFFSRKPIETADTTFDYLRSIGFSETKYYKVGKSLLFNKDTTIYKDHCLIAKFKNELGQLIEQPFPITAEKRKQIRELFIFNG